MSKFFSMKPDLTTLVMLCVALLVAPALYFLYFRARLASDLRQGLNPSEVRMGGFALALASFGVLLTFSKTWGLGWSLLVIVLALVVGWIGRNRGLLILLLGAALLAAVAIAFVRPAALQ